jgi:hypothetical protein
MRDLNHDSLVVLGEGLLPWLAVDPHECVVSCSFVELEPDSMSLAVKFPSATVSGNESTVYQV